ncbi:MAG: efflux RND transporter periplasmic adaptor subunit [Pirellulaceae bacterium]
MFGIQRQLQRCLFLLLIASQNFGSASDATTIEISDVLITAINDVNVPARSRGPINRIDVSEGDQVKAGQSLASIDDGEPRLARQRIAAQLQAAAEEAANDTMVRLAKKALELTQADLQRAIRARGLLADSVSNEEYESRVLKVEKAKLELEQAERELKAAANEVKFLDTDLLICERNLELTQITSPIDGVVVDVRHNVGEWVEPGEEVFRVLRTKRLRAECYVAAEQLTHSIVGKSVTVSVTFPDQKVRTFAGVMRFESPEVVAGDGRVKVWAEIENPDGALRPGMRGRMTVHLKSVESSTADDQSSQARSVDK